MSCVLSVNDYKFATFSVLVAGASYYLAIVYFLKLHYATKHMVCKYVWYLYNVYLHNLLPFNLKEIIIILSYIIYYAPIELRYIFVTMCDTPWWAYTIQRQTTRDLKGPRVDSPCDNLFQSAINIIIRYAF